MESQLSKHFRRTRLAQSISIGRLASLCGYRNLSKGSRRIHSFEHDGSIHKDLLWKMADALGIERATVQALCEEDHSRFIAEWTEWADEPIEPYLVVRLIAAVYSSIDLPEDIQSAEEARMFAAEFSRKHKLRTCLVMSRRISVWFAVDGSIENVTEAVPGQSNTPYMRIGSRKCVMKSVDHGLAFQQVQWPRKQEIRKMEPATESNEAVTDFGGIRMKSSFEIVEDESGQVTINIEGPTFEFTNEVHVAWETSADDVRTVLAAHNVSLDDDRVEELFADLDCGAVEKAVLHYTDFDDQSRAMLNAIENYLLMTGVIKGERKYQ